MESVGTSQKRAWHARKGSDGQWRFSAYSYLLLFPEEEYLAVFRGSINALNHAPSEQTSANFSGDVVGALPEVERMTVTYRGNDYLYQITRFQHHFSTAVVSILVEAVPAEEQQRLPILSSMEEVNLVITRLRLFLREKKGESI